MPRHRSVTRVAPSLPWFRVSAVPPSTSQSPPQWGQVLRRPPISSRSETASHKSGYCGRTTHGHLTIQLVDPTWVRPLHIEDVKCSVHSKGDEERRSTDD